MNRRNFVGSILGMITASALPFKSRLVRGFDPALPVEMNGDFMSLFLASDEQIKQSAGGVILAGWDKPEYPIRATNIIDVTRTSGINIHPLWDMKLLNKPCQKIDLRTNVVEMNIQFADVNSVDMFTVDGCGLIWKQIGRQIGPTGRFTGGSKFVSRGDTLRVNCYLVMPLDARDFAKLKATGMYT